MLATDEETMPKDFLDESIPCDCHVGKDPHEADIYVKFDCEGCDVLYVAATCLPCNEETLGLFERAGCVPCYECRTSCSFEAYTHLGPVR
jgi:hypothetical protein